MFISRSTFLTVTKRKKKTSTEIVNITIALIIHQSLANRIFSNGVLQASAFFLSVVLGFMYPHLSICVRAENKIDSFRTKSPTFAVDTTVTVSETIAVGSGLPLWCIFL
jgi:hypothetical protein